MSKAKKKPENVSAVKYITQTAVIEMGFTRSMIDKLLPPPIEKRNPMYRSAAPMKLFDESVVKAIMKTEEYKKEYEKSQRRRKAAAKAVETKKENTIKTMESLSDAITVEKIDDRLLVKYAIANHKDFNFSRHIDCCFDYDYSDAAFLNRIVVNFIRHRLTTYDFDLYELQGKVGKNEGYALFKNAVLDKIAEVYPQYKEECANQRVHISEDSRKSEGAVIMVISQEWVKENYHGEECFTIPKGFVEIGIFAFAGCENLESVELPEGLTEIGSWAFRWCHNLKSINIPNGVTEIGQGAFETCDSLKSITVPEGVTKIGRGAFAWCENLENINISEGVTSIDAYAFRDCKALKNITIPEGVKTIGEGAFKNCESLESITIPENVTSIGDWAFDCCLSLKNVVIPNNVTRIGDWAFEGCESLEGVAIPESVTEIAYRTFAGCKALKSIKCTKGSFADKYAKENRIRVEYVEM